jgi:hypothetical protein
MGSNDLTNAAAQYGIPYQTYNKRAAFRAALADLQAVKMAGEVGRSRRWAANSRRLLQLRCDAGCE